MMFVLEKAIKRWKKQFHQHPAFDEATVHEMELHLRDHVEDLMADGLSAQEAFSSAVASFGDIPTMAEDELITVKRKTTIWSIIHTYMLKSYFKTTFRVLMRHPLSTTINLLGLSVAVGICLLVYAFGRYLTGFDDFHEHKEEIYLTTMEMQHDDESLQTGWSPFPLGQVLLDELPQVSGICRIVNESVVLKLDQQKVFYENIRFVDPSFFDLFTFPLKWGTPASLQQQDAIILSEEMSVKYFGDKNPIGEQVELTHKSGQKKFFKVAGVAAEFPGARSWAFNFLINIDNLKTIDPDHDPNHWGNRTNALFIRVPEADNIASVREYADQFKNKFKAERKAWHVVSFVFEPFETLYERSGDIRSDIASGGYRNLSNAFITFCTIAFFVMLLAASNYVNIAIVSASRRLGEIGLRKVIGANRRMIIVQFMSENLVLMLVTLVMGVLLGMTLFIPWFQDTLGFNLDFTLLDKRLWLFLPSILFFTAFVSGFYPALYISNFRIAAIFRGGFKIGKRGFMTKVFLGFQIMLACILISIAVLFTQNSIYQSNKSWGYEPNEVIYVNAHNLATVEKLRTLLLQEPDVVKVATSGHQLGRSHSSILVDVADKRHEVNQMHVDFNYFNTMGLQLLQGRGFLPGTSSKLQSDSKSVIINSTMANKLFDGDPEGQILRIKGEKFQVVGVVADFHSYNFFAEVMPTMFRTNIPDQSRYLTIKTRPGRQDDCLKKVQQLYAQVLPDIPFDGGLQVDIWDSFFELMDGGNEFWRILATVVLLLAGLGLYGLVALNLAGRTKELSIRKIMGAGSQTFTMMLLRQYMLVFIIAIVIGTIASYFLTKTIFKNFFVYYMPVDFSFFGYSASILIAAILLVIGYQVKRVTRTNPVEGLHAE